jgi:hypothetical protein
MAISLPIAVEGKHDVRLVSHTNARRESKPSSNLTACRGFLTAGRHPTAPSPNALSSANYHRGAKIADELTSDELDETCTFERTKKMRPAGVRRATGTRYKFLFYAALGDTRYHMSRQQRSCAPYLCWLMEESSVRRVDMRSRAYFGALGMRPRIYH